MYACCRSHPHAGPAMGLPRHPRRQLLWTSLWVLALLAAGFLPAVRADCPGNALVNGGFEEGALDPWYLYDNTGAGATAEVVADGPVEGDACLHVVVPVAGANFWDVGLSQPGFVYEAGKAYTLSAWFKCSTGTLDVNFKPELAADPWSGYGDQVFTITDEWAEYSVTTPVFAEDTSPGSITFHVGFATAEFWVDDVKFYATTE